MNVEADLDGYLRGFPYHDGRIVALTVSRESVRLGFRALSGPSKVLSLLRVKYLSINGYREDNIISTLRAQPVSTASKDMRELFVQLFGVAPERMQPGLWAFVLECSYGGQLVAACEDVELSSDGAILASALHDEHLTPAGPTDTRG